MNREHPTRWPRARWIPTLAALAALAVPARAAEVSVAIATPLEPPGWAVLERELLRANARACEEFFGRYFDDRGYLLCVERWGGDDGPDDAIETLTDWPVLHALGGPDSILALTRKAWEGHLRQYTLARTVDVELAREGMYFREYPVMFDWVHHGEGLAPFLQLGLADPADPRHLARARRFAGFYTGEDPTAPNYDPEHRIIRSLFNGSRGPLLRKATALDWAGDPIVVEGRFKPRHGESSFAQMLEHFERYNDVVGDHPQNLSATSLAVTAFLLTGEAKYRDWVLQYVDAWIERMDANGGVIPSNVGLDGAIGSAAGGKWYGGVYGWGFSVHDPGSGRVAHRNTVHLGLIGFLNAHLLTGDDRYLDAWRRQIAAVNAQKKVVDGREVYPTMHGDEGWYEYRPAPYSHGVGEIYFGSMREDDRARVGGDGWLSYLEGKDPGYPERALRSDFAAIREKVRGMRLDDTTPDTRLADDPLMFNPATVGALVRLTMGGYHPGPRGSLLQSRLRYFDPAARRPGLPPDVAALVETMTADETVVTLVNLDQSDPRTVVVQAGGYAEHRFRGVNSGGTSIEADTPHITVELAPGAGGTLKLRTKRYAAPPTLALPWARR